MGDLEKWDERFRTGDHATHRPTRLLKRVLGGLEPGAALDVACGAGRHAFYLVEKGWKVVAIDGSKVAIDLLRAKDEERTVRTIVADLELPADAEPALVAARAQRDDLLFMPNSYDLVCVFYYLNRPLIPRLLSAVKPGGHIVMAIHCGETDEDAAERPDRLLGPKEMSGLVGDWEILINRVVPSDSDPGDKHAHPTAELFARRPL